MCYQYSLKAKNKNLEKRYSAEMDEEVDVPETVLSAFNNKLKLPIVTSENKIKLFKWGLIPSWSKTKELKFNTANAKMENIDSKPTWKEAFKNQRCLIPATAFYEWRTIGKSKYPYEISLKEESIFSFAGIWDEWLDKTSGEIISSFSIITCKANDMMGKIHNTKQRMPVILNKQNELLWLNSSNSEELIKLLSPMDSSDMKAHTVSRDFRESGLANITPINYPEIELYDA
jgi:putative SOS response-associated peptidase YedK